MIGEGTNGHSHENQPLLSGGQGGPESLSKGPGQTSDTRLIERAIKQRWPIKPEHRAAVVTRMLLIVADKGSSNREAVSAAKALISADSQNQSDEHHAEGETLNLNHSGTVELAAVRQEMLKDAQYLEYRRTHSINSDSSPVRSNGEPRPLENGSAPHGPGQSHNGHTNGNGRH